MVMDLEDVIGVLNELLVHKQQAALTPQESIHKQYVNLGVAEGVKMAVKKLETLQHREAY